MTHPLNVKIKTQITKEFTKFFQENHTDDPELLARIHLIASECNRHIDRLTSKLIEYDR